MYRAGPVPPGTGRTGPVPNGLRTLVVFAGSSAKISRGALCHLMLSSIISTHKACPASHEARTNFSVLYFFIKNRQNIYVSGKF
jgi:hypothetical protein